MSQSTASLREFLLSYESRRDTYGWIDVRSEGEFEKASLPGFMNLPILNDAERHQVGLTYKQKGQAMAIELGHQLVDPQRGTRAALWQSIAKNSPSGEAFLLCWRGGMRSQIATQWTQATGVNARNVQGGFKAVRNELLKSLENVPPLLILGGLTGSGKTELLKKLSAPKMDLEQLAKHRGSSFGRTIALKQPSQATFENLICLGIRQFFSRDLEDYPHIPSLIVEDESVSLGSCFLPRNLKLAMNSSSCIWLESGEEDRILRIFEEYVLQPLKIHTPETVRESLLASLERIERKLGGLETSQLRKLLIEAFSKSQNSTFQVEDHESWISRLLTVYYDPLYRFSFERNQRSFGRKVLFRGTANEILDWLEKGLLP